METVKIHITNNDPNVLKYVTDNCVNSNNNYIINDQTELIKLTDKLNCDTYSVVYYGDNTNRLLYNETCFANTKLSFNTNYSHPKDNICIIIQILNEELDGFERICLEQMYEVYKKHDIYIIAKNDTKIFINNKDTNVLHFDDISRINNDINFYKLFQNKGYEWMLFVSNLNTYVYADELQQFTKLGYDSFGASVEPFFNKKQINKYDIEYNLRNINAHIKLCSELNDDELNNDLIDNVFNHKDIIKLPPKNVQYIFAVKDFPEQQFDIFNSLPLAAINPLNYVNEYDYDDGYSFDNELYIEYKNEHDFYKNHNIDIWSTHNTYKNEINLDIFKKDYYDKLISDFMYNATFPNFSKIDKLLYEAKISDTIPKLVHFCFLGWTDLPEKNKICILSWIEKLQSKGYMFINWTPVLLNIKNNDWLNKCISRKKFAFFADYIRVFALYNYGGIYMDADILVNKPFDELLNFDYVFDKEISPMMNFRLEAGCMLAKKHNSLLKKILYFYDYEIIYPENDDFWKNNYKYDSYIMPDLINGIIKDYKIDVIYNIENLDEYKIRQNSDNKSIHVLNSKFLSSPKMQRSGFKMYDRKYTFASHCFTNSYC